MEKKDTNLWKNALNWGLIIGVISIILSVIFYIIDFKPTNFTRIGLILLFSLLVSVVTLVIAIKSYRDNVLDGYISFKDAFVFGLLVMIIASIVSAVYNYIFLTFIDPDYLKTVFEEALAATEEFMLNRGMSEDDVAKVMEKAAEQPIPTALGSSLKNILNGAIWGAIISLILAAIMKKNKTNTPFEE